jgi:hypothetical protein
VARRARKVKTLMEYILIEIEDNWGCQKRGSEGSAAMF